MHIQIYIYIYIYLFIYLYELPVSAADRHLQGATPIYKTREM